VSRPSPDRIALATAVILVVSVVAVPAVNAAGGETQAGDGATAADGPRIVATLPNPAADGDAGEYVVVDAARAANLTLSDGETRVAVPAGRRVVLTASPAAVPDRVRGERAAASLSLSNAAERLVLRRDGRRVDTLAYEDAPTAERLLVTAEGPTWRPVGFRPREVSRHGPASVRAFVLPDSPDVALAPIRDADERVLIAGYTFASARVADALVAAAGRGATVRVLVEGSPVGGVSPRQASVLDDLVAAGVSVRAVDGDRAPVDYHHPKYAVADDAAVVLTENWKPSGTGGGENRGWGVVVRSPTVADDLASLFAADADGPGTVPWSEAGVDASAETEVLNDDGGQFPSNVAPSTVDAAGVAVLTAPGNTRGAIRRRIDAADERVLVVQPTVGRDSALLAAAVAAAERGVRVRILLSNAWYVAEENRALAESLNARVERGDLPLAARVAEPEGRYGKIHAKGLVVDDAAVVGSLNWNRHAATENREVAVVLDGTAAADYYASVFERDWAASGDRRGAVPRLFVLVVAVVVGVAGAALRRWF
jgi:phosphatidylserine/phosphatidylglycerophosphate/cardiolipin synthase-like enzyme